MCDDNNFAIRSLCLLFFFFCSCLSDFSCPGAFTSNIKPIFLELRIVFMRVCAYIYWQKTFKGRGRKESSSILAFGCCSLCHCHCLYYIFFRLYGTFTLYFVIFEFFTFARACCLLSSVFILLNLMRFTWFYFVIFHINFFFPFLFFNFFFPSFCYVFLYIYKMYVCKCVDCCSFTLHWYCRLFHSHVPTDHSFVRSFVSFVLALCFFLFLSHSLTYHDHY